MGNSSTPRTQEFRATTTGPEPIGVNDGVQPVLETITDPDCRAMLAATNDTRRTAHEIADACDLPLPTTYRKLSQLTDTGLLGEYCRIDGNGHTTNEYELIVGELTVSLDDDGAIELTISPPDTAMSTQS